MKDKKKIILIMACISLVISITLGITYAYFNYTRTGDSNRLIVGDIYLHLNNGNDSISMTNVFPMTKEEARARTDNVLEFTISGLNESNKDIWYEIDIKHGDEESGKIRINDSDLVFDLIEIDSNNNETYLVDAKSYSDISNRRIWVDTVDGGTTSEVEKTYKLRMWLSEDVIISDSDPNASYPATGANAFKNHYASVKVGVTGDFNEKELLEAMNIIKKNVITPANAIIFEYSSSSTNGEGLYILPGTENDTNPIYYYRGNVNNNNVLFGGFCWQIVRTTDTGGIKMIYNGIPDVEENGGSTTYNCGPTREFQNDIRTTTNFNDNTGYYYADDYEIVSISSNSVTYRLKSKNNPITQLLTNTSSNAAANIPTIAANYPYTCKSANSTGTCTNLYKVDSYANGTIANVYASSDISVIGKSAFNSNYQSVPDIGYMKNTRYTYTNAAGASGAIYGKNVEWDGTNYLVIEDIANTASSNTTKDNNHHYSCGTAGTTSCGSVRYYYYNDYYITLTNGEFVEDALYKMTGNIVNPNIDVVTRNQGYVLNQNNSTIKGVIDTWFETNLTNVVDNTKTDYRPYLEDTTFCNDRSFKSQGSVGTYELSGWNPAGGSLSAYLYFGTHNRFKNSWYYNTSHVPTTACPNESDRFTVSSSNGNGLLTYPVGLLTADEIVMAGASGGGGGNLSYYLYTGDAYWTLSPAYFYHNGAMGLAVIRAGDLHDYVVYDSDGVRPVVSLKPGTEFESGGDGTPTNPYVVKYD